MARVHYWQFLVNQEGQPIRDAEISIYLAGTETPASVFPSEYGGDVTSTDPQTYTSPNGYFQFWIAGPDDVDGYDLGQKFKLKWEKTGVASGTIDWVDIFPKIQQIDEVNEDDFYSVTKDKAVSNRLAYQWDNHAKYDIGGGDPLPVHGIEAVDTESLDPTINRLISNANAKDWQDHVDLPSGELPHGIAEVDEYDTDSEKNKLVNNNLINFVFEHAQEDATQATVHPHGIQPVDLTVNNDEINKLVSNNQMIKVLNVGTFKFETLIQSTSWTSAGPDDFQIVIAHGLGTMTPTVTFYNMATSAQEMPETIRAVDDNNVIIKLSEAPDSLVKILG